MGSVSLVILGPGGGHMASGQDKWNGSGSWLATSGNLKVAGPEGGVPLGTQSQKESESAGNTRSALPASKWTNRRLFCSRMSFVLTVPYKPFFLSTEVRITSDHL